MWAHEDPRELQECTPELAELHTQKYSQFAEVVKPQEGTTGIFDCTRDLIMVQVPEKKTEDKFTLSLELWLRSSPWRETSPTLRPSPGGLKHLVYPRGPSIMYCHEKCGWRKPLCALCSVTLLLPPVKPAHPSTTLAGSREGNSRDCTRRSPGCTPLPQSGPLAQMTPVVSVYSCINHSSLSGLKQDTERYVDERDANGWGSALVSFRLALSPGPAPCSSRGLCRPRL